MIVLFITGVLIYMIGQRMDRKEKKERARDHRELEALLERLERS